MKKLKLLIPIFIIFFICLFYIINTKDKNENSISNTKTEVIKKSESLSMMLETGSNTGVYEATTRESWPTEGYIFNSELSKCENGSKLSWNDENNTVVMTGSTSDKCYVYFDVYNSVVINEVTLSSTSNSITVRINATSGTSSISKYYYSKDNGLSYEESTESEYTFSNLVKATNYKIKVYVKDSNEVSSKIISKEIETKNSVLLADYIKSLYTTQGANGLYLHNSSLANSANDGSYRYAGANPNNYVCFGTDAESCPNDNLYRIIGVFGDKVKLIKYDYANSNLLGTTGTYTSSTYSASGYSTYKGNLTTINRYYWTNSSNQGNVWSGSALNTTNLNGTFLTNLGTTWANKIAEASWKVGGNTWANIGTVAMKTAYQNEIVTPAANTTHQAKIGLMYVSDYGYAASSDFWTYKGNNTETTDYRAAVNENWLYMGLNEWMISRNLDDSFKVFFANESGQVSNNSANKYNISIRPTFYLNSDVAIDGEHIGSKIDPYRIIK